MCDNNEIEIEGDGSEYVLHLDVEEENEGLVSIRLLNEFEDPDAADLVVTDPGAAKIDVEGEGEEEVDDNHLDEYTGGRPRKRRRAIKDWKELCAQAYASPRSVSRVARENDVDPKSIRYWRAQIAKHDLNAPEKARVWDNKHSMPRSGRPPLDGELHGRLWLFFEANQGFSHPHSLSGAGGLSSRGSWCNGRAQHPFQQLDGFFYNVVLKTCTEKKRKRERLPSR